MLAKTFPMLLFVSIFTNKPRERNGYMVGLTASLAIDLVQDQLRNRASILTFNLVYNFDSFLTNSYVFLQGLRLVSRHLHPVSKTRVSIAFTNLCRPLRINILKLRFEIPSLALVYSSQISQILNFIALE
jgi:hypothetical protein